MLGLRLLQRILDLGQRYAERRPRHGVQVGFGSGQVNGAVDVRQALSRGQCRGRRGGLQFVERAHRLGAGGRGGPSL